MYLQKVKKQNKLEMNYSFVGILEVTEAGSGSGNKVYEYKDPDPYLNFTDPEHCRETNISNTNVHISLGVKPLRVWILHFICMRIRRAKSMRICLGPNPDLGINITHLLCFFLNIFLIYILPKSSLL